MENIAVESLESKRRKAIAYLGDGYVFSSNYRLRLHHSPQYKQSHTLQQFLLARGAIAAGRV